MHEITTYNLTIEELITFLTTQPNGKYAQSLLVSDNTEIKSLTYKPVNCIVFSGVLFEQPFQKIGNAWGQLSIDGIILIDPQLKYPDEWLISWKRMGFPVALLNLIPNNEK